ncbi:MAG: diadenylate cyclase CdaA [Chloroflexi bacterium]|nr:diadenylate cyclase CdaA [Chloroflexota bacterium]
MSNLADEISFFLQRVDPLAILDLLLVSAVFFFVISLLRGTRAVVLLRGMVLLIIVMALLTGLLPLPGFQSLLSATLPALLFVIPVVFAPEIRRAFERVGRAGSFFSLYSEPAEAERTVNLIVSASERLSEIRHGALITIEREDRLGEYIETGVALDAKLSTELLLQIFYVNTPLHDGAVILRDDRVAAASVVMPLSSGGTLSRGAERTLGLRHRAALGISEVSDAVSVVISEETGNISITHNGRMIRRLDRSRLRNILIAFYRPRRLAGLPNWLNRWLVRASRAGATGD